MSDEKGKRPSVEVVNLKTNDEAKFHASWSDTLQQVWDKAYSEMGETRHPKDIFECDEGTSLMGKLGETLENLRDSKLCQSRKFQIRGETGGAK
jgi:hypothetical protein